MSELAKVLHRSVTTIKASVIELNRCDDIHAVLEGDEKLTETTTIEMTLGGKRMIDAVNELRRRERVEAHVGHLIAQAADDYTMTKERIKNEIKNNGSVIFVIRRNAERATQAETVFDWTGHLREYVMAHGLLDGVDKWITDLQDRLTTNDVTRFSGIQQVITLEEHDAIRHLFADNKWMIERIA